MPLQTRQLAGSVTANAVTANTGAADCTLCGAANQAWLFQAALTSAPLVHPEIALEGEAACYEHADKRAIGACQRCGRFVCQFCSVEFGTEVLCPSCVAGGGVTSARLNPSLTMFDSIALIAPLASLIIYPFTIIAAPASLVLSIVKWKQPISPVRRNRWRFVLAIIISLIMIGLWIWGIVYFVALMAKNGSTQRP
jgi:uncharacterized membrane protein YidH (DUF202 family)